MRDNTSLQNQEYRNLINTGKYHLELEKMRKTFYFFLKNGMLRYFVSPDREVVLGQHVQILSLALQDATEGKMLNQSKLVKDAPHLIKKAFIMPPNHSKSAIGNVLYAMWLIGNNPNEKIRVITNNDKLALSFLQDYALIAKSDLYKQIFPNIHFNITQKGLMVVDENGEQTNLQRGEITVHTPNVGVPKGFSATTIIFDDFNDANTDGISREQIKKTPERYSAVVTRLREGITIDGKPARLKEIVLQQTLDQDDLTAYIRKELHELWDIYCIPARIDNFEDLKKENNLPVYHFAQTKKVLVNGQYQEKPISIVRKHKMLCPELLSEAKSMTITPTVWRLQYQQDITGGQEDKVFQDIHILNAHDTLLNNEAFCLTKEQVKEKMEIIIACDPAYLKKKEGDSFGIVVLGYYKPNVNDPKPSNNSDKVTPYGLQVKEGIREWKPCVYFLEDRTIHAKTTTPQTQVRDKIIQVCQDWQPSKIIYESNGCPFFTQLYAECLPYCNATSIDKLFVDYYASSKISFYKICNDYMRSVYNNGLIKHIKIYKTQNEIMYNSISKLESQMTQMSQDIEVRNKQSNDIISAFSWGFYYFYEKYFAKVKNNNNVIQINYNYQLSDSVRKHYFL